jgi:DNA-binding NarL/FixJ family response regulator
MVEIALHLIISTAVMDAMLELSFVQCRRALAWPRVLCQPKGAILLRIFLVDDNAMARAAVKMALQQHAGWVVVGEASDGGQALETFRTYAPQVTVMDFLMPEMNGLDTARRLTERNPNVLILMITSDPSSQLEEQAREAGIKGVCAKGELHRLENAIDAVIHGGTYFSENIAA